MSGESGVWVCPLCDWVVPDVLYLSIKCDPDCPGCGAKKYSEFQFETDLASLKQRRTP